MAKRRGSEIFNFVFNFIMCWNFVCLGDLECLLCVHNVVDYVCVLYSHLLGNVWS